MFHGTYDRAARADRYRAVAAEYNRLFKTAPQCGQRSATIQALNAFMSALSRFI